LIQQRLLFGGPTKLEEENITIRIADCGLRNKKTKRFWILDSGFWILIALLPFAFTVGCASTQDLQLTQRDLQDQRNKIATTQREVTEAKESLQGVQKGQAELDNKTDRIRTEIQNLQGKLDEIKFHAEKASNDTLAMREEMTAKLKEQDEKLIAVRKDVDTLKTSITPPPAIISQTQPGVTPPSSLEGDSAEELYNAAYSKWKAEDLEGARSAFKNFLQIYPHHELSDNAQFWIGESYFREKKYEEAVVEFEEVVKKYPKENKVPDAMLKEGLAFYELEKVKESKYILKKLIDKYPKSEPAKIAKSRLEEM
jgi:tol-pal system protein YbgF